MVEHAQAHIPLKSRTRRSYPKEFKAKLVALCNTGNHSVAHIALEHRINANLLRRWQKQALEQVSDTAMVPVQVRPSTTNPTHGVIEVAIGSTVVRFSGRVDPADARSVLDALR